MRHTSPVRDSYGRFAGKTCDAEEAGYDGMFGVYCSLPRGHSGPHNDGIVEWDYVDPRYRNSDLPVVNPLEEEQDVSAGTPLVS